MTQSSAKAPQTMIKVSTQIQATLAEVWRAYTTPEDIVRWNAASDDWHTTKAEVDLREGGAFSSRMEAKDGSFGFDFAGTYTKITPMAEIAYVFGGRNAQVSFHEGAGNVLVTVAFEPEDQHSTEHQQSGWQAILDNFRNYVENRR